MVSKQLSFVNISHPEESRSRRVKASVRRHVMADVGRSRRKRAKYRIIPLQVATVDIATDAGLVNVASAELTPLGRMPPAFQTFLIDSNARASELITFMTAEADYVYRPFRISWIQIGLSDTTAFDLWLAQAVVIRDSLLHQEIAVSPCAEYLDNSEALKYYFKSLNRLSHRLNSREDCVSNGVIATIMGFICVDTRVGNWDRYAVHMDGLERIYQLRNGFDGLDSEINLMAFWVDLMGASMLDRYPRFPIPGRLTNSSQMTNEDDIPQTLRALLHRAEKMAPQGKRIYAMLRMVAPVIAMVNRNSRNALFWTQDVILVETLGVASHFLLSVPKQPEDDAQTDYSVFLVQRMVQLACLMIMSEFKRLASFSWADINPLCARFVNLLPESCYEIPTDLKRLRLWAIMTACCLVPPEARDPFLVEARQSMRDLGFHTAEQVIECTKSIIWLESIEPVSWEGLFASDNV